jgi:gamma-glutamyltranspeptidase / glutathione hydrolase
VTANPWMVFGTMGGDGQPQIHTQLLGAMVDDDEDPQAAVDRPALDRRRRGRSRPVEEPTSIRRDRRGAAPAGHELRELPARSHSAGHAHAIQVTPAGYVAGSDPRCEGAVIGC